MLAFERLVRTRSRRTDERMHTDSSRVITTAVIAAAGSASRMWPASKIYPKELFPLGRLPVIAHLVWEMVAAGITNLVIVVRNDNSKAIERFLDPSLPPPDGVRNDPLVQRFQEIIARPRYAFVEQNGPYGNGTPLLNGFDASDGKACVYAFADDVVFGENVTTGLVRTHEATGAVVLAAQRVPKADTSKFGILDTRKSGGVNRITKFVEKPAPGETTSTLASLGRYLVTPELVETLKNTPTGKGDELWLADAFRSLLAAGRPLAAFPLTAGRWHTVGNPQGYRQALLAAMRVEDQESPYAPGPLA
jgi:UTP--glucose-1-phosphate uridylyltransferase